MGIYHLSLSTKSDDLVRLGLGRECDAAERRKWLISRAKKYPPYHKGLKYKCVVIACLSGQFDSGFKIAAFTMDSHEKVVEALQTIKIG
jgi:hypothetical protein